MNTSIENVRAIEIAEKAFRAGDKNFARQMLAKILSRDPQLISAWALMAQVVDVEAQRLDCWRRVIALDPEHAEARKALGLDAPPETGTAALVENEADTEPRFSAEILQPESTPIPTVTESLPETNRQEGQDLERRRLRERADEKAAAITRQKTATATLPPRLGMVVLIILGILLLVSLGLVVGGSIWFFTNYPAFQPLLVNGQAGRFLLTMAFPSILIVLGFIGVLLTSLGLYNATAGQQDAWRLNDSKTIVDGVIVDAWTERAGKKGSAATNFWVAYQFEVGLTTGGTEKFTVKEQVSEEVFVRLALGVSVPVRILLENPKVSRLNFRTF